MVQAFILIYSKCGEIRHNPPEHSYAKLCCPCYTYDVSDVDVSDTKIGYVEHENDVVPPYNDVAYSTTLDVTGSPIEAISSDGNDVVYSDVVMVNGHVTTSNGYVINLNDDVITSNGDVTDVQRQIVSRSDDGADDVSQSSGDDNESTVSF